MSTRPLLPTLTISKEMCKRLHMTPMVQIYSIIIIAIGIVSKLPSLVVLRSAWGD